MPQRLVRFIQIAVYMSPLPQLRTYWRANGMCEGSWSREFPWHLPSVHTQDLTQLGLVFSIAWQAMSFSSPIPRGCTQIYGGESR